MSSQNNYREFFELYTKLFVSLGGKNQCKFKAKLLAEQLIRKTTESNRSQHVK